MLISTQRFGDLEPRADNTFKLMRPMAGFPNTKALVLVERPGQFPFFWLQSLEEPGVAFACAPMVAMRADYDLQLASWDSAQWGPLQPQQVVGVLSFQPEASINLAAPVLLDRAKGLALQVLNSKGSYGFQESLQA